MNLAQYQTEALTPAALDHLYSNRTQETQDFLQQLLDLDNTDDYLPTAHGTYGRGSAAYGCQRQHAFSHLGVPEDYPFSGATHLTFSIGNWIHAAIQTAWHFAYGAEVEVPVDLRPLGYDTSGHIDLVHGDEPVELKSVSDYAFNKAVGNWKKQAEGPGLEHVVQAGVYALGLGADRFRVVYVNKGKHDSIFEWVIPLDVVEPLVRQELDKLEQSRRQVADGLLPARESAEFGLIDNVPQHISKTGKWGSPFFCSGCRWRDTCADLPTGPVPYEEEQEQVA